MLFNDEDTYSMQMDEMDDLFRVGGFPHKRPKNGRATKVYVRSLEMVQDIKKGTFLDRWEIDSSWLDEITDRNRDALLMKVAEDPMKWLRVALMCRSEAMSDKTLFPRDKKTLDCDFPSFLCNERSGKSWFIHFLMRGVQTIDEAQSAEWVSKVPKSFHTAMLNLGLNRWKKDLPLYAEGVVRLHEWYKSNREFTDKWMWIRTPVDFWTSYLGFLADMLKCTPPSKGHFMPEGKTHRAWMKHEEL